MDFYTFPRILRLPLIFHTITNVFRKSLRFYTIDGFSGDLRNFSRPLNFRSAPIFRHSTMIFLAGGENFYKQTIFSQLDRFSPFSGRFRLIGFWSDAKHFFEKARFFFDARNFQNVSLTQQKSAGRNIFWKSSFKFFIVIKISPAVFPIFRHLSRRPTLP